MRASTAAIIVLLLLGASACCTSPWRAFPHMPGPPDSSFRTAGTHGYDVYVWECTEGERTVIYKYTAEMTCAEPEMVKGPCGEITDFEKSLGGTDIVAVPENLAWPE